MTSLGLDYTRDTHTQIHTHTHTHTPPWDYTVLGRHTNTHTPLGLDYSGDTHTDTHTHAHTPHCQIR